MMTDACDSTIDDLWQKVKSYEALLLQFGPKVDKDDQQAIKDAISLVFILW